MRHSHRRSWLWYMYVLKIIVLSNFDLDLEGFAITTRLKGIAKLTFQGTFTYIVKNIFLNSLWKITLIFSIKKTNVFISILALFFNNKFKKVNFTYVQNFFNIFNNSFLNCCYRFIKRICKIDFSDRKFSDL